MGLCTRRRLDQDPLTPDRRSTDDAGPEDPGLRRYAGAENAYRGDDLPYGGFRTPLCCCARITAKPSDYELQWELDPTGNIDPADATARTILDAVGQVCNATAPGLLLEDPTPRYRHDDRIRIG